MKGFSSIMGLEEDVFIGNSLIQFYAECGDLDYAQKVFDEMLEINTVSWTSLICGCGWRNMPKEAVSLFFEMVATGIKPNSVTTVCVIYACAKLKDAASSVCHTHRKAFKTSSSSCSICGKLWSLFG
ncbi:pentatricopeptide repeat-containing protein [Rosa sericea]